MGWTAHELNNGSRLWVRHGLRGWYVQHSSSVEMTEIPFKLIVTLAAEEIRSQRISDLESMTDEDVLGLPRAGRG